MIELLKDISNFEQNIICGAFGAILVLIYQIYLALPDINADMFSVENKSKKIILVDLIN